ncbi:MAG: dihydropteroate synthase [Pseudonocardiaceae bacterium]
MTAGPSRTLPTDRAAVMAIVNRTPDSSDRGATYSDDAAMAAVDRAVAEGADIVDIGGVKAGPGDEVGVAEETRRVVPFIALVRERYPGLLISVDTWRDEVARPALDAGADILNDTWAGLDPKLAEVAAENGCGVVCSYPSGAVPRTMPHRFRYTDVVHGVIGDLASQADELVGLGVPKEAILIDPTHHFGANTWPGLDLLHRCDELVATGWPVLMTLSNKDFIGEALGKGVDDPVEGTLAATAVAAWAGVRVFRVHQVLQTRRVLEMVASIAGTRPPTRAVRGLA